VRPQMDMLEPCAYRPTGTLRYFDKVPEQKVIYKASII
jgi:hypothetical protein